MDVEPILSVRCELGEGPRWNADEGSLYWVDIAGRCFYTFTPATGDVARYEVGQQIGCLAFRAAGGLVMAAEAGFTFWDRPTEALTVVADPPDRDRAQEPRFNDGAVDPQGRFWAGTIAAEPEQRPTARLYRLDPDRSVHTLASGVGVANGIGWSLDHRTMYFTDSPRRVIYAYDFDPATGAIDHRRPFARLDDEDGVPDGLAVDSQGLVWSAIWDGWRVVRFDPDGRVERELPLPVQRPTSCAFGGPQLDELYITSAWVGLNERQRQEQPSAGGLFRVHVGVRGVVEPRFAG